MNELIWLTFSEVIGYILLGGIIVFVYSYGMFLCCAVYDYQDEKPKEEKCFLDYDIKIWMNSQFYFVYYVGFIQFISLCAAPITLNSFVYPICFLGVFLFHLQCVSYFTYLYVQYIYTFQPDDIKDIETSSYKKKSLFWKFFLTCFTQLLSILFPLEDKPILFQILTKGVKYNR